MPVKSLKELAIKACIRHITKITNVGDMAIATVRDIIDRVTSPSQLELLESTSPQLRGESVDLWKKLIRRDFPTESKKKEYCPDDPKDWAGVYLRYKRENEADLAGAHAELLRKLGALQAQRDENTSKPMTGLSALRPVAGRTWSRAGAGPAIGASSKSRLIMNKLRREAAMVTSRISQPGPNKVVTPFGVIGKKASAGLASDRSNMQRSKQGANPAGPPTRPRLAPPPPPPPNKAAEAAAEPPFRRQDTDETQTGRETADEDPAGVDDLFGDTRTEILPEIVPQTLPEIPRAKMWGPLASHVEPPSETQPGPESQPAHGTSPEQQAAAAPAAAPPSSRKRKAVNIFMKRKAKRPAA